MLSVLYETSSILSEINRIGLFSDLGIKDGIVDVRLFDKNLARVFDVANRYGLPIEDVAEIAKQVEKVSTAAIPSEEIFEAVAGFKVLENEIESKVITPYYATIRANYQDVPGHVINDLLFNYSKATKLSFDASIRNFAFGSGSAKETNTSAPDLAKILTITTPTTPGDRGNAGRGQRSLNQGLINVDTIALLESLGVAVFDAERNFLGLNRIYGNIDAVYHSYKLESDEKANAFLNAIGGSLNGKSSLSALLNATPEERAIASAQFENIEGDYAAAVASQVDQAEESITRLQNKFKELQIYFTKSFIPVVAKLNDRIDLLFGDTEVANTVSKFGEVLGDEVLATMEAIIPVVATLFNIFKENEGLIRLTAQSAIYLFGALSTFSVVFGLLGFFAALKFAVRGLSREMPFLTRGFTKFANAIKTKVIPQMLRFFVLARTKLFGGINFGAIVARFGGAGILSGITFGSFFTIFSGAYIRAKGWLNAIIGGITSRFFVAGLVAGSVFGAAFATISNIYNTIIGGFRTLFVRLGLISLVGGGAGGLAYSAAYSATSVSGIATPSRWARLFGKTAAFSAVGGAASGAVYGGGFSSVAGLQMTKPKVWKNIFGKTAVAATLGGVLTGTVYGRTFSATSAIAVAKPGRLARFFTPLVVSSAVTGTASGTAFGTAFIIAAIAAIAILAVAAIDIVGELITGRSTLKHIQRELGVDNPQSALDVIDNIFGTNIKRDHDINEQTGGFLGGGIRPREPGRHKEEDSKSDDTPYIFGDEDIDIPTLLEQLESDLETDLKVDVGKDGYLKDLNTENFEYGVDVDKSIEDF